MRKIICLLCVLVLLPVSSFAWGSPDGTPMAFDFDFGFEMDPDAFLKEDYRTALGYSELLNRTRISGTYVLAGNGTDRFDLKLDLSIGDKKTETISLHLFGTSDYDLYLTSPLLGNEMLYVRLELWLPLALKMYDYFNIPLQNLVLLMPYITKQGTDGLKGLWENTFMNVSNISLTQDEVIQLAGNLQELWNEDGNLRDWLKAIGIRSGFVDVVEEEMETVEDYVRNRFPNGLTRIVGENCETWMSGETIIATRHTENGEEIFSLLLPATEQYELVTEINNKTQMAGKGTNINLDMEIASDEENWLDLILTGKNIPDTCFFTEPFVLDIKTTGYLTGENDLKIVGETTDDDGFAISFFLIDKSIGQYQQAVRVTGTFEKALNYSNPPYDLTEEYEWVYVGGLSDSSLSELINNIAGPFVKGILPVLVQVPTITCQVILDQLTEHGVLSLLTGDLDLGN